jgi:hypothetical protein
MKLDPGMHIGLHLVSFGTSGVTKDLLESVGAAAADYQVRTWDLQEVSRHNYNHLCYLGGLSTREGPSC